MKQTAQTTAQTTTHTTAQTLKTKRIYYYSSVNNPRFLPNPMQQDDYFLMIPSLMMMFSNIL